MAARKAQATKQLQAPARRLPPEDRTSKEPKKSRVVRQAMSASKELYYRPTLSGWTPDKIQGVRDSADAGVMLSLADLIETMHRDARISGVLSTRTHGMLGMPLGFDGGDNRARDALAEKNASGEANSNFWRMADESELAKLLRWGLLMGVGLAQIIEQPRVMGQPHQYRLETWSPRWLTYYHYGSGDSGAKWRVLTQQGQVDVFQGDGQWILFMPYGSRRPWAEGLWTQLAFPWLLKHYSLEDRANFSQVLGSPIWVGMTKHGGTQKQRMDFLNQLHNLGKSGKFVLPEGWDLQLREAQSAGKSGDVFDQQIQQSNEEMTIALAGQLVTTEGTPGFSSGNIHESIKQDLVRFDAKRLASCLQSQLLEHWALYNFGSRTAAPWPAWQTEKPEDISEKSDGLKKLGDALTSLNTALAAHGLKVDVQKMCADMNIPVVVSNGIA